MKSISTFLLLLLMATGASAQNCVKAYAKCKSISMSFDAGNIEDCQKGLKLCSLAQKTCAEEKELEKMRMASAHYLNCRNGCPKNILKASFK